METEMHNTYKALYHLNEASLSVEDTDLSKAIHNLYEEVEQSTLASRPAETKPDITPESKPAAKTTKKRTSKKVVSKKTPPKKKSISELIEELPEGDMELLPAPFALLKALPEDRREQYLCGIDVAEYITDKIISDATKQGADKLLVNEVMSLAKVSRPDVDEAVPYDSWPPKWNAALTNATAAIGEHGDDLWNEIMSIYGVNKQTLQDILDIAKAKRAGTV